jgi:endoglucanase
MGNLTDPSNKIVYEMHQYLDLDGSGTHPECVNSTIGAERIAEATVWLRENKKLGILGEFAGGNNSVCESAVTGMLDSLTANNDVWMGAMWWGAGPFWGDYIFSMEPPNGNGFVAYIDTLVRYTPGGAGAGPPNSTKITVIVDKGNSTGNQNSTLATPTLTTGPVQVTGGVASVSIRSGPVVILVTFAFVLAMFS